MQSKYKSESNQQTVTTLITRLNNRDERIILDTPYQRNIVWESYNMSKFIDSVIKGIVPTNIIFNVDNDCNYDCIDGKQRLTSLLWFKANKIPLIMIENDKETHYYYDKVPIVELSKSNITYKVLDQTNKNIFNQMQIHVTSYHNLSYEEQVDIFHRIQHGKKLTSGEKIVACFTNDEATKYFSNFCKNKENIFKKFIKNTTRKEHVPHIINIMYMINNCINHVPSPIFRERYMRSIDGLDKMKNHLNKIDKLIDICYGDRLLGHMSVSRNTYINVRHSYVFLVHKIFVSENCKLSETHYTNLRSVLRKVNRDIEKNYSGINPSKSDKNTCDKLFSIMRKYYDELKKKNCEASDEDYFEEEPDDTFECENDSDNDTNDSIDIDDMNDINPNNNNNGNNIDIIDDKEKYGNDANANTNGHNVDDINQNLKTKRKAKSNKKSAKITKAIKTTKTAKRGRVVAK